MTRHPEPNRDVAIWIKTGLHGVRSSRSRLVVFGVFWILYRQFRVASYHYGTVSDFVIGRIKRRESDVYICHDDARALVFGRPRLGVDRFHALNVAR